MSTWRDGAIRRSRRQGGLLDPPSPSQPASEPRAELPSLPARTVPTPQRTASNQTRLSLSQEHQIAGPSVPDLASGGVSGPNGAAALAARTTPKQAFSSDQQDLEHPSRASSSSAESPRAGASAEETPRSRPESASPRASHVSSPRPHSWDEADEAQEEIEAEGGEAGGAGGEAGEAGPQPTLLSLSDDLIVAVLAFVERTLTASEGVRRLCALRLVCRRVRAAVDAAGGPLALPSGLHVARGNERLAGLVLRRPAAFSGLRAAEIEPVRWDAERVFRALPRPELLLSLRLALQGEGPLAALAALPRRCPALRALALHLSSAEEADMGGPLGSALRAWPALEALELADAHVARWDDLLGPPAPGAAPFPARPARLALDGCYTRIERHYHRVMDLAGLPATAAGGGVRALSLRGPLTGEVASLPALCDLPELEELALAGLGPADPPAPLPTLAFPRLTRLDLAAFQCWPETATRLIEACGPTLERLALDLSPAAEQQPGSAPRPFAEDAPRAARIAAALRGAPLEALRLSGDPDGGKPEVAVLLAALAGPRLRRLEVLHPHPHSSNPLPFPRLAAALAAAPALAALALGTSDRTALDALAALPGGLRHLALHLGPDEPLWAAALEACAAGPLPPALRTLRLAAATREAAAIMGRWRPAEGPAGELARRGILLQLDLAAPPPARR